MPALWRGWFFFDFIGMFSPKSERNQKAIDRISFSLKISTGLIFHSLLYTYVIIVGTYWDPRGKESAPHQTYTYHVVYSEGCILVADKLFQLINDNTYDITIIADMV